MAGWKSETAGTGGLGEEGDEQRGGPAGRRENEMLSSLKSEQDTNMKRGGGAPVLDVPYIFETSATTPEIGRSSYFLTDC